MESATPNELKKISVAFSAREQAEGVGAKVRRFIGVQQLELLDPFLMLDLFNVALPAGFPDHPHRGFETVTYMLKGEMSHEDFKGHKGVIGPGAIQWMTAGKGIVHSEIPMSFDTPAFGFQLWINLDKQNKYCDPRYQEFTADQIPVYEDDTIKAKVIAGQVFGVKGPIEARVPTYFLDFYVKKGREYEHPIPKGWNSMIIVHSGSLEVQGQKILRAGDCSAFETSQTTEQNIKIKALADDTAFVLLAGQPINEPMSRRGPFVLNTPDELKKTFYDYSTGSNGFEGADSWESKNQHLRYGKH